MHIFLRNSVWTTDHMKKMTSRMPLIPTVAVEHHSNSNGVAMHSIMAKGHGNLAKGDITCRYLLSHSPGGSTPCEFCPGVHLHGTHIFSEVLGVSDGTI